MGTCVDINYNKRRCNDSADHHCAGTSRLFVANLPTAPNQQNFGPGATSVGEKAIRKQGLTTHEVTSENGFSEDNLWLITSGYLVTL